MSALAVVLLVFLVASLGRKTSKIHPARQAPVFEVGLELSVAATRSRGAAMAAILLVLIILLLLVVAGSGGQL